MIPRYNFLPISLPLKLEIVLRYMISINMGLCLVNIIAAFGLDGKFALRSLLKHFNIGSDIIFKAITTINAITIVGSILYIAASMVVPFRSPTILQLLVERFLTMADLKS